MCLLCVSGLASRRQTHRARILQLLALVEDTDALPADAALRLAREVLDLAEAEPTERRCDAVGPFGSEVQCATPNTEERS